jgi:hypothetical protein
VDPDLERHRPALQVDQDRRPDHRPHLPLLLTHLRTGTLERHGGRTVDGVTIRILQRILALTAAIWHNDATGQPVMRSLVAYDH